MRFVKCTTLLVIGLMVHRPAMANKQHPAMESLNVSTDPQLTCILYQYDNFKTWGGADAGKQAQPVVNIGLKVGNAP